MEIGQEQGLTKKYSYGISITDLQTFAKKDAHSPGCMMPNNREMSKIPRDIRFHQSLVAC